MIDIIIPAYNAHNTIKKTLISVCMQTVKDKINVYIIDDCSNEDYKEIINIFKDKINIKYYKLKENSGPGVARQYGIENSNGEYIYFLDADDMFMDIYSLENLVNNINDNDIICGNVFYEGYNNSILSISNNYSFQLHGKLYKRSYIKKYNFKFNKSRNGEDNCFNRLLKIGTEKYKLINSDTSLYSYTKNSITKSTNDYLFNEVKELTKNMIWLADEADKRNFPKEKIIYELYNELIHFINVYIEFYDEKDNTIIYDGFDTILKRIESYKINLSKEVKYEIIGNNICDTNLLKVIEIIYSSIKKEIKQQFTKSK